MSFVGVVSHIKFVQFWKNPESLGLVNQDSQKSARCRDGCGIPSRSQPCLIKNHTLHGFSKRESSRVRRSLAFLVTILYQTGYGSVKKKLSEKCRYRAETWLKHTGAERTITLKQPLLFWTGLIISQRMQESPLEGAGVSL